MFKFFLNSKRQYPIVAAIASGLYPLIFYYSRNFTMIDSWEHLGIFVALFLVFPIIVFKIADVFAKKSTFSAGKYLLPFLNLFLFLFLLKIILFTGPQKKIILGILIFSAIVVYFFYPHFKKWILFQLILAAIGLFTLVPVLAQNLAYSHDWAQQPDAIEKVILKKKPNIYYIQPDGYVNFSELKKGYYNYDNTDFEDYLAANNFSIYPNFRSNYDGTLASNSSTFMMKHHLYSANAGHGEVARARDIVMGENMVLKILKNNGYKTYFFSEYPYLLMNRPSIEYDYSNFSYSEVPFFGSGLENKKEILPDFKRILEEDADAQPKFFFVEIFNPKHIDGSSDGKNIVESKRTEYLRNLAKANGLLKETIGVILKNDPDALIMIMADHGGYVGMERPQQGNVKTDDENLVRSVFSSILSIHWPQQNAPAFEDSLKTSVNVFRILFSDLSENPSYLRYLEEDITYGLILKGAPKGIYELIDENNKVVFKAKTLFGEE